MLLQKKRKPFFDYNNKHFSKSQKLLFPKGLTHAIFFVCVDLEKFRLEIMLNDVAQEKETFLTLKNWIFQSPKNRIFPKGLTQAFDQKMPISSLFRFGQNKTRNIAYCLCREKKNLCDLKKINRIFQSPNNRIFSKGFNPRFWSKILLYVALPRFGQNKTRNNA